MITSCLSFGDGCACVLSVPLFLFPPKGQGHVAGLFPQVKSIFSFFFSLGFHVSRYCRSFRRTLFWYYPAIASPTRRPPARAEARRSSTRCEGFSFPLFFFSQKPPAPFFPSPASPRRHRFSPPIQQAQRFPFFLPAICPPPFPLLFFSPLKQ